MKQQPDPYLRYASSTWPMTGFLLLEAALCRCEGVCECELDDEAAPSPDTTALPPDGGVET